MTDLRATSFVWTTNLKVVERADLCPRETDAIKDGKLTILSLRQRLFDDQKIIHRARLYRLLSRKEKLSEIYAAQQTKSSQSSSHFLIAGLQRQQ